MRGPAKFDPLRQRLPFAARQPHEAKKSSRGCCGSGSALPVPQESKALLFLKKKKQKDFANKITDEWLAPSPFGQKFFGSFFQERTRFLFVVARGNGAVGPE